MVHKVIPVLSVSKLSIVGRLWRSSTNLPLMKRSWFVVQAPLDDQFSQPPSRSAPIPTNITVITIKSKQQKRYTYTIRWNCENVLTFEDLLQATTSSSRLIEGSPLLGPSPVQSILRFMVVDMIGFLFFTQPRDFSRICTILYTIHMHLGFCI